MTSRVYFSPFLPTFSGNGLPVANARLYFFYTGTTNPAPIYSDAAMTTIIGNPVISDGAARYPNIYLDETITYRVRETGATGVPLAADIDPYIPGTAYVVVPDLPELADPGGAALIGEETGRTVQDLLWQTHGGMQGGSAAFYNPPFAGFGGMIPNTTDSVMIGRLQNPDFLIIRTLGPAPNYVIDETILRKATLGGFETVGQRAFFQSKSRNWYTGPLVAEQSSDADWAVRIGNMANPYVRSVEGNWRYRGFGHEGYTNTHANNQVILTGGTDGNPAVNLNDIANLPVNTWKKGTGLSISSTFVLLMPVTDVDAITLTYNQDFASSYGYRRFADLIRIAATVGMQDSYICGMMPMNPYALTAFKPTGLIQGRVLSDSLGKPSPGYGQAPTYPSPWLNSTATVVRAIHEGDPTLFGALNLDYGQPLRASDGSIAAWGWNTYGRIVQTDFPDYAKLYFYACSSQEAEVGATARALAAGVHYQAQTSFRTIYDPAGAP